ncbi:MAG: HAD family hydrolase [Kiritimatiellae bacterium]|nr:HAD family hydrolase [Kiritimatiellia bacterium]
MKTEKPERTIVFDLDGTLETPYFTNDKKKNVKAWMQRHPCGNTFDRMYVQIPVGKEKYPHFFLNGAFELLRWVHDSGFEIVFFSNAVKERNEKLCPILMQRAFEGTEVPPYRILSRNGFRRWPDGAAVSADA